LSYDEPDDLMLAQLMCSRICHDLVGPVGAVNTAVELLQDGDSGLDKEAFGVLERSVREAGARLALFRSAFGFGGGPDAVLGVAMLAELIERIVPAGKVAFRHEATTESGDPMTEVPAFIGKLALILAMIGLDALPRGGSLALHLAGLEDGMGLGVQAEGTGAAIKDAVRTALVGEDVEINARNVHAHLAHRLANRIDAGIEISSEPDTIGIAVLVAR